MPRKLGGLALTFVFFLTLAFLLATQFSYPRSQAASSPQSGAASQSPDPLALIKNITVNHAEKVEAAISEVKVKRSSGIEGPGRANMPLYKDDEVTTGSTAQVTLLFLDNPQEKDNEVLVDSNTRVSIGSLFTWVGRVLVRVKGTFATRTTRVRLGVQGTEFEVMVAADGTNTIKVLKGSVDVTTGDFSPFAKNPVEISPNEGAPLFLRTAFFEQETLSQQKEVEFVVVSGQVTNVEREFTFANTCQRKHTFQIKGPRNLEWFQMLGADQFSVDPQSTRSFKFAFRIDGTRAPVGSQENEIVARCLDCTQEATCGLGGLLLPIIIKVVGSGSVQPSPTPSPTQEIPPGPQSIAATKLELITLPPAGRLIKTETSAEQIQQTLDWSDDLILEGQPTYSAQSVVPRFRTWEERDRAFGQARRDSILSNDSNSNEILAQVYVDWGNGAKAEQELRESALTSTDPERLTTLGEANRLMGRLDDAEAVLKRALSIDPSRAITLNALGNVYLDKAKAAKERNTFALAKDYLEQANTAYTQALQSANRPGLQHHQQPARPLVNPTNAKAIAQSNIGEVHLKLGEIAREQGNAPEALAEYRVAARTFQDAAGMDNGNQFAFTGLGDAYREAGEVFVSRNEKANADQYFALSRDHYVQAAKLHGDMSEAYIGLGRVLGDTGNHDDEIKYLVRAAQLHPEQPDPHYYLAVAYARFDPQKAAEEARLYLKVERLVFKQGDKANNAGRIKDGLPPVTPTPTPEPTATAQPTATVTPSPTPPPRFVKVPDVKDKSVKDALKELTKRELQGRTEEIADCKASGKVLYSDPAKDANAPVGSTVKLFISSAGPDAVRVPDLRHRPRQDAEDELRRVGLTVSYDRPFPTNAEQANNVVRQKPDPYKPMMPGCAVELTLAIPIPQVQVPNFVGLTRDEALRRLPRFTFGGGLLRGNVSQVQKCDDGLSNGKVIAQRPPAGQWVDQGTPVDLVIAICTPNDSPGRAQLPGEGWPPGDSSRLALYLDVPCAVGMSFTEARNALAAGGLMPKYQDGDHPFSSLFTKSNSAGRPGFSENSREVVVPQFLTHRRSMSSRTRIVASSKIGARGS